MPDRAVNESRLWAWIFSGTRRMKDLHINRVENALGNGTPDVEGCCASNQFWIELKCASRPKRPTTNIKVRFRPGQIPWMEKRRSVGGCVYVLLQVGSGHHARRYLIRGEQAHMLEEGQPERVINQLSIADGEANARYLIERASFALLL